MANVSYSHRVNLGTIRVLLTSPQRGIVQDLLRRGLLVETAAKRNLAGVGGPKRIDTGRLRASITTQLVQDVGGSPAVLIGTNVKYACVLGARTSVVTSMGLRTIGQIKPGELVLTQSGEFRPVVAVSAIAAALKPDLVEIVVPWRNGGTHTLTLTSDHKILVRRGPRFKWVPAGELRSTDELQVRRKVAHNRDTGMIQACEQCRTTFRGQGQRHRRFCSPTCRDAFWRRVGHWMNGKDRGEAFRQAQSESRKRLYAEQPEIHPNRAGTTVSQAERLVGFWLALLGIEFEFRKAVDQLWPDFYVPSQHRIYEADGAYWHRDQAKDIARDQRLIEAMPDVEIVHMHFYDARHSPELEPNPLPGVWYVPVNPSPDSYVEPTEFKGVRPLTIRPYRYQYEGHPKGRRPLLYDLTVDGEHSFVANGILISNSFVHEGTGIYGPKGQPIRPRRAKFLRFRPGRRGKYVYARQVKGMAPNRFLTNALPAARG